MSQHDRYISPFSTRYSSDEMQYIFSDDNKFRTWRRLWVALARAEMNQGLTPNHQGGCGQVRRNSKPIPHPIRAYADALPKRRSIVAHKRCGR